MNKIKVEYFLYALFILNPLFDISSYVFSQNGYSSTPATYLRPLLIIISLVIIFITKKQWRTRLFILGLIYSIYGVIHLYVYSKIYSSFSYGTYLMEAQYILNYTYLFITLLAFYIINPDKKALIRWIFISSSIYIVSIYLSILTSSYSPTYVEGFGIKGWFNTGGQIGSILTLSLFLCYKILFDYGKVYKYLGIIFYLLTSYYLLFLLGTRVGMFGAILFYSSLIVAIIINKVAHNSFSKKQVIVGGLVLLLFVSSITYFGSQTIERRKYLKSIKDDNVHIALELNDYLIDYRAGKISNYNINLDQINALLELEVWANENNLSNINLRKQQLVYHSYLYSNQDNIVYKLFGNGFLAHNPRLILELEFVALLFNFGIFGFVLYLLPFLFIFGHCLIKYFNSKKQVELSLYGAGIIVVYLVSYLSGHVFFNAAVIPFIVAIHILAYQEVCDE